MAVNRTPVLKRCRSLEMDPVYLGIDKKSRRKAKNAGRKVSEYGMQLREKQKAKFIYGVLEKPFRNYYKKAERQKGMTGENLMIMLELRLDNVLFRLGFARTRKEARQIVDHKHVLVNGKCVNIPSYLVKAGDVIEIREKSKSSARYKEILESTNGRLVPEWLEADADALKGSVKSIPTREVIDVPVNEMLIVELYSMFYTRSGGGLTLSGGEALAQPDFALALLREAKKRHIHTTIETCGHYPTEVLDQACRALDALIFDIKCLDSARHKKATGVGSELILKNIGHVFEHFPDLPVLIRTPVIPGFNDTEEDILGIREMIPRKANIRYEALTYHRMGQPKYGYLGRRYELEGVKADEAFMKRLNIMLKSYEK